GWRLEPVPRPLQPVEARRQLRVVPYPGPQLSRLVGRQLVPQQAHQFVGTASHRFPSADETRELSASCAASSRRMARTSRLSTAPSVIPSTSATCLYDNPSKRT